MTQPPPARALAALHGRCFVTPRPWTDTEFETTLADRTTHFLGDGAGFALIRVVSDEAELLTIAVDPPAQGQGHGARLLQAAEARAQALGAQRMLLEVAATNGAAQALYARAGYTQVGNRARYYRAPDGTRIDARVLAKSLATDLHAPRA